MSFSCSDMEVVIKEVGEFMVFFLQTSDFGKKVDRKQFFVLQVPFLKRKYGVGPMGYILFIKEQLIIEN